MIVSSLFFLGALSYTVVCYLLLLPCYAIHKLIKFYRFCLLGILLSFLAHRTPTNIAVV